MAAPLGKHRPVAQQQFLESFRRWGTIGPACAEVGINRSAVYDWLDSDAEFAEAFTTARENLTDALESSVYSRAFKDPILAMFYLKAHRPVFKDKLSIDVAGVQAEIEELLRRTGVNPRRMLSSLAQDGSTSEPPRLLAAPKADDADSIDN